MELGLTSFLIIVSVVMLVTQFSIFVRDNWGNQSWRRLAKPMTLKEMLLDWIAYVMILSFLFLMIRGVLCLACSYCQQCE